MTVATTQTAYDTTYGDNAAENYERYFVPVIPRRFGSALIKEARLRPGERVLDLACGTGIIARMAVEQVGPAGLVAGVDVNSAMLDTARAVNAGLPIKWYESSAESIPLPDRTFDVAFCQLGLQFIADQAAALRELRRVLVPGGRVYINTPVPNEFFDVLDREIARHVSEEASAFVHAVFSLHDPHVLADLLTNAGFAQADVRVHTEHIQLPGPRDFMWHYISCTPLLALLQQAGKAQNQALEDAVATGWQPWRTKAGMSYDQAVLVGTATVPAA